MTCGISVKPSRDFSARTSIIGTYFLSALEAPALMPLPSLVRPTLDSRTKYLPERAMRKSGRVLQVGFEPLGVLTNLVSTTGFCSQWLSCLHKFLRRYQPSLVSTTVSTRTTEYTPSVVRVGSGKLLSVGTKPFNHARSGTILPVSGVSGSSEAKYAHA